MRRKSQTARCRRRTSAGLLLLPPDDVERATGLEPLDVLLRERVGALDLGRGVVRVVDARAYGRVGCQAREPEHRDAVVLVDLVVRGRVGESEGKDALLLQVSISDERGRPAA